MSLIGFITSKAAGVLAAGALAAGGAGGAAYTGSLPDPVQQSAHDLIGAPAPHAAAARHADASGEDDGDGASPSASATPVGPDATGPAAFGLCQAFTHGGLNAKSTAYASLAKAANGASNIATYCAGIAHPGESASHRATPGHPKPSESAKPQAEVPSPGATGSAHRSAAAGRG